MIAGTMPSLLEQIDGARSDGKLRPDAAENIRRILSGEEGDFAVRVIGELSQANEWEELNDRFYKTLAFGTGGLDRKSTRLNSSHGYISYAVFCLKKKKKTT